MSVITPPAESTNQSVIDRTRTVSRNRATTRRAKKRRGKSPIAKRPFTLIGLSAAVVFAMLPISPARAQGPVPFANFSSCPKLMAYLRSYLESTMGPYGPGSGQGVVAPGTRTTKSKAVARANPASPPTTAAAAAPSATDASAGVPEATAAAPAAAVASAPQFSGPENSSTTNVQEAGVDEGDEVETDGRYLYTAIGDGSVRIVDTTTGELVARIPSYGNGAEPSLILDGTRLAVSRPLYDQNGPETVVELYSVLNPARPEFLSRTHLEGTALAVRSVNHRARIVLNSPMGIRFRWVQPVSNTQAAFNKATSQNVAILKRAVVGDWVPRTYTELPGGQRTAIRPALDCREIGKPAERSGLGLVWVATLDLDTPNPQSGARGSGGVVTGGGMAYSSAKTLYVTTTTGGGWWGGPVPVDVGITGSGQNPNRITTAFHAFDLGSSDGATYQASGSVPGTMLNQFSMSEHNGVLRIATTTPNEGFGSRQESGVHIFARNGRRLQEIGSVGGLGRNEQIYGVRFLGDLGYVVTFRQTDPLYVIDLRDPRQPRVAGELKIPGYSAYLHPMEPGYLIGVGQDATDAGRRLGTMLQVFDVRDPYKPTQVAKLRIGGQSEAEYNHHAFLWWPRTGDAFVPNQTYENNQTFAGLVVTNVTKTKVTERGRVLHQFQGVPSQFGGPPVPIVTPPVGIAPPIGIPAPPIAPPNTFVPTTTPTTPPTTMVPQLYQDPIRRAVIVNGKLVTVGAFSVKVSDLQSLKESLFTKFE